MAKGSQEKSISVTTPVMMAGFYFFIIFIVMPLTVNIIAKDSILTRMPLLVGVLMMGLAIRYRRPLKQIRLTVQYFYILSFFYLLSSLYGPDAPGLMEGIIMLFRWLGLGVTLVLAIRSVNDLEFMMKILVWSAVVSSCYGLVFVIPGLTPIGFVLHSIGLPLGRDWYALRMIGIQTDPTYFGLSILPGFLISLNDVLRMRGQSTWLAIGIVVLLFLAIILTFSRSTWGGTLIGVVLLTGFSKHLFKAILLVVIFLLVMQFTAMDDFLASAASENASRTSLDLDEQADSRTWIWKAYFELALATPWGYGMNSLETLRMFATYSQELSNSTARPHNIYLVLWVESGLQSLIPFLMLLGLSMRRAWSMRHYGDLATGKEYGNLAFAMIVSMSVGLFSLGGMMQLLSITIALGLSIWYLKVEKKLVPLNIDKIKG